MSARQGAPVHLTDRGHGPGYKSVPLKGWRARLGWRLRCLADRIDDAGAAKSMSQWSFTFEDYEGIRFRDDGWGCPLSYSGEARYARAHDESDTAEQKRRDDGGMVGTLAGLGETGIATADRIGLGNRVRARRALMDTQVAVDDAERANEQATASADPGVRLRSARAVADAQRALQAARRADEEARG